jgi:hypothetical protein
MLKMAIPWHASKPLFITMLLLHCRREAFGRSDELNRPANMVKQKGKGGKNAKDSGEDLSGVAQFSSREELYALAWAQPIPV